MPPRFIPSSFYEKYPFTTGVIRKTPVDLSTAFEDRKITIAGWQTILASNNFAVCSHLSYKIHSQNNAAIPLLPFCSIEDKWIKQIYLTNDIDQPDISVDFIIVHPPTKLNYTGIYSQTIDTEGSITAILSQIEQNTDTLESILGVGNLTTLLTAIQGYVDGLETSLGAGDLTTLLTALGTYTDGLEAALGAGDLTTILGNILNKNAEIDAVLDNVLTKNAEIDAVLDNVLTKNTEIDAVLDNILTKNTEIDAAQDLTNTKLTTIDAVLDNSKGTLDLIRNEHNAKLESLKTEQDLTNTKLTIIDASLKTTDHLSLINHLSATTYNDSTVISLPDDKKFKILSVYIKCAAAPTAMSITLTIASTIVIFALDTDALKAITTWGIGLFHIGNTMASLPLPDAWVFGGGSSNFLRVVHTGQNPDSIEVAYLIEL